MHWSKRKIITCQGYLRTLTVPWLIVLFAGCSSEAPTPKLFSPPPSLNNPLTPTSVRSPSAMEAISRGVAAITPPSAALKDIYYQFDSVELGEEAQETLRQNAEYNLALGAKRAQVAKDFLVKLGIAPDRLVTISYGKEAPACLEHSEECRVKNRRARFVMFTELPTS